MKSISYLFYALFIITLLSACSDNASVGTTNEASSETVDEPVDVAATQDLEASLMSVNNKFGEAKSQSIDVTIETQLSEQTDTERQSLIDDTLVSSTQKLDDEADQMAESLEELKEIEHAPLSDQD